MGTTASSSRMDDKECRSSVVYQFQPRAEYRHWNSLSVVVSLYSSYKTVFPITLNPITLNAYNPITLNPITLNPITLSPIAL